ncbi:transposase [Vibrio vulnificus]|nr:transposase [Vibrio vulnificus]MCA3882974.1 transposase [Vibrio vulnificus]MCA3949301.1 transposase [Vibrio vulnificus]
MFGLMDVPQQRSPDYSYISKRVQAVEVKYSHPSQGAVAHLVLDSTGLKFYGKG